MQTTAKSIVLMFLFSTLLPMFSCISGKQSVLPVIYASPSAYGYGSGRLPWAVLIIDPDKVHEADHLEDRLFMTSDLSIKKLSLSRSHEDDALHSVLKAMPGFVQQMTSIDNTSPFSDKYVLRREHQKIQLDVVVSMGTNVPICYAKLAGQDHGEIGVLFVCSSFGMPSKSHTPLGIICESWDRLLELSGIFEEYRDWSKMCVLLGDFEYAGLYAITGFDFDSIPAWAFEKFSIKPKEGRN